GASTTMHPSALPVPDAPQSVRCGTRRPIEMVVPVMRARNLVLLLLLIPFVAVLYPPFYAGRQPEWMSIPYFIWYQFAWTIITAVLTIFVYYVHGRASDGAADERAEPGATVETEGPSVHTTPRGA